MTPDMDRMLNEDGCPECGSEDTYETIGTVGEQDGISLVICDSCGWTVYGSKVEPNDIRHYVP